jgi:hypothetical protein
VAGLLRRRLDALERQIAEDEAAMAAAADVPRLFLIEEEYDLAIRRAEVAWVRGFLAEIEDGSLPGLDMWREFHKTGELPPEIAELAERGAPGK